MLTSLDEADLKDLGFEVDVKTLVLSRARRAADIGCDGIIASGIEANDLKEEFGERVLIVCPGIRPIENIQKDPNIGPAGSDLGHHGVLGIPITLEEKVIGVIFFLSFKERAFDKQEVSLLSSIGDQIAVAIAKAKLYKELSKKNRYEEIIRSVTQSIHQSIYLQEVLENAVEAMNENIDVA